MVTYLFVNVVEEDEDQINFKRSLSFKQFMEGKPCVRFNYSIVIQNKINENKQDKNKVLFEGITFDKKSKFCFGTSRSSDSNVSSRN